MAQQYFCNYRNWELDNRLDGTLRSISEQTDSKIKRGVTMSRASIELHASRYLHLTHLSSEGAPVRWTEGHPSHQEITRMI